MTCNWLIGSRSGLGNEDRLSMEMGVIVEVVVSGVEMRRSASEWTVDGMALLRISAGIVIDGTATGCIMMGGA